MRVAASGHCKTDPSITQTATQKTTIAIFEKMVTGAVHTKLVLDPSRNSHQERVAPKLDTNCFCRKQLRQGLVYTPNQSRNAERLKNSAKGAMTPYGTQTSTDAVAVVRRGHYDGGNPLNSGLT